MKIAILAAGAGKMICGSCLRDGGLAVALRKLGHNVALVPLYTPLRCESDPDAVDEIFYGGINVYLQHAAAVFRHTPRAFDWLLDRPWLLGAAGEMGAQTPPEKLADLTASILQGDQGPVRKELARLIDFLRGFAPQVVSIPNLMFIGMAGAIRRELSVPVVCELTGEDIFLGAMAEPDRVRLHDAIRQRVGDVARFISTTTYYAGQMAAYLDIAPGRIAVVPTGLAPEYFAPSARRDRAAGTAGVVGYLARVCPEKGLHQLVDAVNLLRREPQFAATRLVAAGYLGSAHRRWFEDLQARVKASPLAADFQYLGEVDLAAKLAMLDGLDVLSVPTTYAESKGIYALEAMARGVPLVLPDHGSFPELIQSHGGGILYRAGNAQAHAAALARLLGDPPLRQSLGVAGQAAVRQSFTHDHMAQSAVKIYRELA